MTTKFCKVCNCETERHPNGRCKPCKLAYLYKWRKENPDKFRSIQDKWDGKNQDRLKEAARALYEANRLEKIAYAKRYYDENKAHLSVKKIDWRNRNYGKVLEYCSNRRAKKMAAGGVLTPGLREKLFVMQKGKCACCGEPLGDNYHMDHIMPLALGGTNTDDNIQLLRQRCNNQKHKKHPIDFMQERGFLL